ncbi:bifunctional 3,4-dihydroxy-2-butanone-4-phosphate synthase/GTP cyclohydrolase II [Mangrovibacillus cuniculi]|uniref:Riboflavin biosynthesis protein RibBA n=1 Tax=Mangrovibacillus cuniculi TaxID=2593652 RepID=A0A7S8CB33_9BACI|nr:bifunctional 3,4-dihydroxy-2-butanone-4-phosphate synthase/GTP cyclohydrolase II [Mangrovibacillus cuniculi]QPC46586.1 bifunctional 3,4-dihydroxy-2-butanone-4-phosphate synthase/GTP cyclohydrolase II [Mangrovibacillus cuniculi]
MFSTIEDALADLKQGKMIIVVDDEDRENEGDFVGIAELATPEMINTMAKEGRGLICAPITEQRAKELDLVPMTTNNTDPHGTAFTISVDHENSTTGISAFERSFTIQSLVAEDTKPIQLKRPGHIFPLVAREGGVIRRAGHTEAAVDLARLSGFKPGGIICEIMNEDGTMARLPDLQKLAVEKGYKLITIQDLIEYRRKHETWVTKEETIQLPTDFGNFKMVGFTSELDGKEHVALVKGDIQEGDTPLVRVHSECLTGDVFFSQRCDCGPQLHAAIKQIEESEKGVLLYLRQEGRGIGLINKLKAYKLQEQGLDTVQANESLGFKDDLRDYGMGAQMLYELGVRKMKLLTNNPRKITGLKGHGLEIVERVPIIMPSKEANQQYMETKKSKLGHLLQH